MSSALPALPPCPDTARAVSSLYRAARLCSGARVQHNVWYSGLFISGIAVDEASGDVFFSDAAGNRVVHQSANGTLLDVWQYGFYSPMQLAYNNETRTLYVADSTNNRVGVINVTSGAVTWSKTAQDLTSCSALALHAPSLTLWVVDGWGLALQSLELSTFKWAVPVTLSTITPNPPRYLSSASMLLSIAALQDGPIWLADALTDAAYFEMSRDATWAFNATNTSAISAIHIQPGDVEWYNYSLYILSQPAADQRMTITEYDSTGHVVQRWHAAGRRLAGVPFYGWAMYVDSRRNMYVSSHGVDEVSSPYGRVVKLSPAGTELGAWSMNDSVTYSFTSVWYDDTSASGGLCALWMTEREQGLFRIGTDGTVLLPPYAAPRDSNDNRTAAFSGITEDFSSSDYDNANTDTARQLRPVHYQAVALLAAPPQLRTARHIGRPARPQHRRAGGRPQLAGDPLVGH